MNRDLKEVFFPWYYPNNAMICMSMTTNINMDYIVKFITKWLEYHNMVLCSYSFTEYFENEVIILGDRK